MSSSPSVAEFMPTIEPDELIKKLSDPGDPHRKYLAGDVLPLLRELFERDGEFHLALYELEDEEPRPLASSSP